MKNELFDLNRVEVSIKINEKKDMLAQVSLTYGDLVIYGYRVMKSDFGDGLFIQPPTIRAKNGKWLWIVKILDQKKWNELQNKIKEEYKQAKTAYDQYKERGVEDVDPDDIPF